MEPRPAATVVVARPGPEGVEVLVLERSAESRFAPGFVVFPGGALEPGDEELAARWFGSPEHAARACAVRELYEETGLLATAQGLVVAASGPGVVPVESLAFDPPDSGSIPEISRWIAPPIIARRFDARFYAVPAPEGLDPVPDGVEIRRAWWAAAGNVLAAAAGGEAPLMWPTLKTLEALRECGSVEDVLGLDIPQVEPRWDELELANRIAGRPVSWREPDR